MPAQDSPYPFLVQSVERLHQEQLTLAQFLTNLDVADMYLQHWAARLEKIPLPPGLDSASHLLNGIQQGVAMLWEASGELREADTHDDPERLDAALVLAQEGHELILEVLRCSEQSLEELG